MKTVRDVTFDLLRDLNIKTIFGNPGSTEETFLENFPSDFTYIQTLQEASAVAAADGFTQMTGNVGMVNIHTAAGLSNAMSNIFTAQMNQTPLIITAGNQTREMLLMEPWLTNVKPEELPKPFVKWSYEPKRAEDVPGAFMRAFAMALQEPSGPVFLSIPLDDWNKPFNGDTLKRSIGSKFGADPERIAQFANVLNQAKNPVLIYGADIPRDNGWKEATELAEKLNIPVFAAPASERTPFPEDHPLYAGGLPFATKPLSDKLAGFDVALLIGAPVFRYYPYVPGPYLPDGMTLLHITNDPDLAAKAPVGDTLLSNATYAIKQLIPLVTTHKKDLTLKKTTHNMASHPISQASETTTNMLNALDVFKVIRDTVPKHTILVEETPSNLADLHSVWPITAHDEFYTFASGSLGWGTPAAVGIALGEKANGGNRPVVAIVGDGSFQYAIQGIWTANQHDLPIIYVIPVNKEYGILKSFSKAQQTPNVPGLDIPDLDITSLGKGYGCQSVEATTLNDVKEAVELALDSKKTTVIAVPINPSIPPLI